MYFKGVLVALFFIVPGGVSGQYMELGFNGGFSQYFGDLQSGFVASETHVNFGVFGRFNYRRRLAFRAQFLQTNLSGNDANQKKISTVQYNRNLSFKSRLFELSVLGEFYLSAYDIRAGKVSAPYVFAGLAIFYNSPRARFDQKWYDLHSLGTEGQTLEGGKEKYSKVNLAIPFGAGLKFSLNERVNLGFEFGWRYALSDYLDDC